MGDQAPTEVTRYWAKVDEKKGKATKLFRETRTNSKVSVDFVNRNWVWERDSLKLAASGIGGDIYEELTEAQALTLLIGWGMEWNSAEELLSEPA